MGKPMTPIQITRALEDAGSSQADVARKCYVSRTTVWLVVHNKGTSQSVRSQIAATLNMDEDAIWGTQQAPDNPHPETGNKPHDHS